ncbi:MAG: hypothetical protein MUC56_04845 [Thermoanaerobaculales bacterium]|jgi:hypothetical protein|nr:hypothetical protein [Thermoanaerobaculales bacterium]
MSPNLILAIMAVVGTSFVSTEVARFPGDVFDRDLKVYLQRRAMEQWPGPAQMLRVWRTAELEPHERVAILLGASAAHDPILLPVYREALGSDDARIRMAAAYGYRDLLGDVLPDVTSGVDREAADRLIREIELVEDTLRERTLVELWLQTALASEGASLPGWRGVVLKRSTGACWSALERTIQLEDFPILATAFRITDHRPTRIALMRLIEAVTLQQFLDLPSDGRTAWGTKDIDDALAATDAYLAVWFDDRCFAGDPRALLSSAMNALGARGVDPVGPTSWEVWLQLLRRGTPPWRLMAARQLYRLGGRWAELSLFRAESAREIEARDALIAWYQPGPTHLLQRQRPEGPP